MLIVALDTLLCSTRAQPVFADHEWRSGAFASGAPRHLVARRAAIASVERSPSIEGGSDRLPS
jgi:hypothetical protein